MTILEPNSTPIVWLELRLSVLGEFTFLFYELVEDAGFSSVGVTDHDQFK
jgi:hypothetical protein